MVADDVDKLGVFTVALHIAKVEKALVALGFRGYLIRGQEGIEVHCDKLRIFHLVLCASGVDRHSVEGCASRRTVEVFVFDLAQSATVYRVGVIRAKALNVELRQPDPLLMGRDLIAMGIKPGPEMGKILKAAWNAQLDGEFLDHDGAVEWYKRYATQNN